MFFVPVVPAAIATPAGGAATTATAPATADVGVAILTCTTAGTDVGTKDKGVATATGEKPREQPPSRTHLEVHPGSYAGGSSYVFLR